jgi:hypothetical protein
MLVPPLQELAKHSPKFEHFLLDFTKLAGYNVGTCRYMYKNAEVVYK